MTIFNDLISGIGKEFEKVQNKSQEIMQSYNITTQVKDLERKRNAKVLELGRMIVDKYTSNREVTEETLRERAAEVAGLDLEINQLQAEVDSLKVSNDPTTPASERANSKAGYNPTPGHECPRCHAPASKDNKFCPLCGETLKKGDDIVDVDASNN